MLQTTLVTDYSLRERTKLVLALAQLRKEWQVAAQGGSLLKIEAAVGVVLSDVADMLQLTPQERHIFLGGRLCNEVDALKEVMVGTIRPI